MTTSTDGNVEMEVEVARTTKDLGVVLSMYWTPMTPAPSAPAPRPMRTGAVLGARSRPRLSGRAGSVEKVPANSGGTHCKSGRSE